MNKVSLQGKEEEVRAALERVWRSGKSEAFARLTTLERFLDEMRSGGIDQKSLSAALSAAHRLSGSLGMFGVEEGSSSAAEIEALLCHQTHPDVAVLAERMRRLRELMEDGPPLTRMQRKSAS